MGQVLVNVARLTGQPVRDVLREPYALTLWTWWIIQEQQERETLRLEHARIDAAGLQALAFHAPKQLHKVESDFLARARLVGETEFERDRWREAAKERLKRLDVLKPISPEEAGVTSI